MSSTEQNETSEEMSLDNVLIKVQIDRSFSSSIKDNVNGSIVNEEERPAPSTSDDKLHRRNPMTVRQEIQLFDGFIPETSLADLQLNEMPGLQNTEQWKRIAARIAQASPLSRKYCQSSTCISDSPNGYIPEALGSYRRPGRTENEQNLPSVLPSLFHTPRRKILLIASIVIILISVITAVVVAVILVRRPGKTTTDYYPGSVYVQARFDPHLLDISSTLAKNYRSEFCTLIATTLADTQTKYAVFYSACSINSFRNGSIIADFILGFTRYQNVTRLNAFLNRTLVYKRLFGGTIVSIIFNSTINTSINFSDYDNSYDDRDPIDAYMVDTESLKSNSQPILVQTTETVKQSTELNRIIDNNSTKSNDVEEKIFEQFSSRPNR